MQIIVDQYFKNPLPDDVAPLATPTEVIDSADPGVLNKQSRIILDRTDVVTHKYRKDVSVEVGFLAKLFKGTGKTVNAGVTQEVKHYRVERSSQGRDVEIGIAVRLAVATSNFEFNAELSVPNLAAAAQLGIADTKVGIYVVGFSGPIGDIMPAPEDLNVENFSEFIQAFKLIQKRVFNIDYVDFQHPTLLGYSKETSGDR